MNRNQSAKISIASVAASGSSKQWKDIVIDIENSKRNIFWVIILEYTCKSYQSIYLLPRIWCHMSTALPVPWNEVHCWFTTWCVKYDGWTKLHGRKAAKAIIESSAS